MFANIHCTCGHSITVIHHNKSCAIEAHDFTPAVVREIEEHNAKRGCNMPITLDGYKTPSMKGYKNK